MAVTASMASLRIHPICGQRPRRFDRQPPLGAFVGGVYAVGDASGGGVTLTWLPEGQTSSPVGPSAAKYIWRIDRIMHMVSPSPAASLDLWFQIAAGFDPAYPTTGLYFHAVATSVGASAQAGQLWSAAISSFVPPHLIIPHSSWPLGIISIFETNVAATYYAFSVKGYLWDKKAVEEDGLGMESPESLRRGPDGG